jgi:hypothetical protein
MPARMGSPRKRFVGTLKAKRADGSFTELYESLIVGTDPTLNGSIWPTETSFTVHQLPSGEDVQVYDDGTAMVSNTGEKLVIL